MAATLAFGLPENSRVKRQLSGMPCDMITFLLATAVDRLSVLLWQNTEDGINGENMPKSIVTALYNDDTANRDIIEFDTGAEFENARAKIVGG